MNTDDEQFVDAHVLRKRVRREEGTAAAAAATAPTASAAAIDTAAAAIDTAAAR